MSTVVVVGEVVLDRIIQDGHHNDVLGGSAANTALALVRCGHHVDLRARFGSDKAGHFLKSQTQALGIDITNSINATQHATVVEAVIDQSGVPTFTFKLDNTADWFWTTEELSTALAPDTVAITTGSPASIANPGFGALFEWTAQQVKQGLAFFYDPNIRPSVIEPLGLQDVARPRLFQWMSLATVVKASDEDLRWLSPDAPTRETAAHLSTLGPTLVVLTEGARGASAFCAGSLVTEVQAPSVTVADTVGAGDTVMAWLISGLTGLVRETWTEKAVLDVLLTRAVKAAAYTCTQVGANPIVATSLEEFLAE